MISVRKGRYYANRMMATAHLSPTHSSCRHSDGDAEHRKALHHDRSDLNLRDLSVTRRCHGAIIEQGANGIIPIRPNGRAWKDDSPATIARNETLRATQYLGRTLWRKWSEYHIRSRVEARMNCLKLFDERIMSRDPDRQTAEIQTRITIMNRFNALGTAEIEAVA